MVQSVEIFRNISGLILGFCQDASVRDGKPEKHIQKAFYFDRKIQFGLVGFCRFLVGILNLLKLVGLCFCWGGWRLTVAYLICYPCCMKLQ